MVDSANKVDGIITAPAAMQLSLINLRLVNTFITSCLLKGRLYVLVFSEGAEKFRIILSTKGTPTKTIQGTREIVSKNVL